MKGLGRKLLMTVPMAFTLASQPALANEQDKGSSPGIEFKLDKWSYPQGNYTLTDGSSCSINPLGESKLSNITGMYLVSLLAKNNPKGVDGFCVVPDLNGSSNEANTTKQSRFFREYETLAKSAYGAFLRKTFKDVVATEGNKNIDFAKWDQIARVVSVGIPQLSPELLVSDYKLGAEVIKEHKEEVKQFLEKVQQKPNRWINISSYDYEPTARFILRRLIDLGYGPDNYMEGLEKLDDLVAKYETFLGSKLKL